MACLTDSQVYSFLHGELDTPALHAIDVHLDDCGACRRVVATLGCTSTASDSPMVRHVPRGATIGNYVVLDVLGRGGMGLVYSAYDPELDRKVALKWAFGTEQVARDRLRHEAQAMAQLSHPNVIAVYGLEQTHDGGFLAMEHVVGMT